MGSHYGNTALIDGTAQVDKPQLLLYEPEQNGRLRSPDGWPKARHVPRSLRQALGELERCFTSWYMNVWPS
jgi:hypothetical protein